MTRRSGLAAVVVAACLAVPGIVDASPGGDLFSKEGCASCHTLIAAGATGTVGPDLSYLNPTIAVVVSKLLSGGGGMPSYRGAFSRSQLAMFAYWVSWAANLAVLSPSRVKTIQRHLAKLGYFHHRLTNVYGPATTAAVKTFQKANGLSATGIWGPRTAAAVARQLASRGHG
jgi:hypothetical protein